jgi:hypothetical protein
LEPEVLSTIPDVEPKAGHPSSVPSPPLVVAAADRGMDQKEQAETAVAVVAAGELILLKQAVVGIRRPLLPRKATMAAPIREAEATKAVLAAVEQVKLAQLGLLAARQAKAEMVYPAASAVPQQPTVVVAAVQPQPLDIMEMVVPGVAVVGINRALQILVVAVVGGVVAQWPQVGGLG